MQKGMIITKGTYQHPQSDELVFLKQYMFVRGTDGKKHLYLRFQNGHSEACQSFKFLLRLMDTKGNVVHEEWYEKKDFTFEAGATYTYDGDIVVGENCTDFRLQLVSAAYGDYLYRVKNAGVMVTYRKVKLPMNKMDAKGRRAARRAAKRERKLAKRTMEPRLKRKPMAGAVIALFALTAIFVLTAVILSMFGENRINFSLEGVDYKFVDKEDGTREVIVTGYHGDGDMLLPSTIEGYPVAKIVDGAFKNNGDLKNVRIEGLNIPQDAFNSCENLETVELVGVNSIGDRAFYRCTSLNGIASDSVTSIGAYAFGDCKSMKALRITVPADAATVGEALTAPANAVMSLSDTPEEPVAPDAAEEEKDTLTIGEYAFINCIKLDTVVIEREMIYPDKIAIFHNDLAVRHLDIPNFAYSGEGEDTSKSVGVQYIGELFGLENKTAELLHLEDVSIDYIDQIPVGFFEGIKTLKHFRAEKSTWDVLPEKAFNGCTSLETLKLGSPVTEVGAFAVAGTQITNFDASKVSTIGVSAFEGCSKLVRVNIPQTSELDFIGEAAFKNCSSMQSMYIPVGVKQLFPETFMGCSKMFSFKFSSDSEIVTVPEDLFNGCSALLGIVIPDTVQTIEKNAFSGCSALRSVPTSIDLLTIGEGAFKNSGITSLYLEDTVTEIGKGAFEGCNKLVDVSIPFLGGTEDDPQPYFGYIFGLEIGALMPPDPDADPDAAPVVKEDVGSIPASIATVWVSKQYDEIPDYAFYKTTGLTVYELGNNVTKLGESSFRDCKSLHTINLPEGITTIPEQAFRGCEALSDIEFPTTLEMIASAAFYGAGLKSLVLPESVTSVALGAFEKCNKLKEVTLPCLFGAQGETPYFGYIFGMVIDRTGAEITGTLPTFTGEIPASVKQVTLTKTYNSLPDYAFYHCRGLESYAFPDILISIGNYAFAGCESLTGVQIPEKVTAISAYAFAYCKSLTYALMPEDLMLIGISAFAGCAKLPEMVTYDRLGMIEEMAFADCTALSSFTSGTALEYIKDGAFKGCTALSYLSLNSTIKQIGVAAFAGCTALPEVVIIMNAGEGVIDSQAFFGCTAITNAKFSTAFKRINDSAFEGCTALKTLKLPYNELDSIGERAFFGCTALEELTLPKNMYFIGESAFEGCTGLLSATLPTELETLGTAAFRGCTSLTLLSLPTTVEEIRSEAFRGCSKLGVVSFPTSIKYIGNYAFADCISLLEAQLAVRGGGDINGEFPPEIGVGAFSGCIALQNVHIQNTITAIGDSAFSGCIALTDVTFGGGLDHIGANAFEKCASLVNFAFPAFIQSIGDSAFSACVSLTSLDVDTPLIGNSAFAGCLSLASAELYAGEGNLLFVGDMAFAACSALTSLKFSGEVDHIGVGAFQNCTALSDLVFTADVGDICESAFQNCTALPSVAVSVAIRFIGTNAFAGCTGVGFIDLDAVENIGDFAFAGCTGAARLEANVTDGIGTGAFSGCSGIVDVNMIVGGSIGREAFLNCSGMKSAVVAVSGDIGGYAFSGCTGLENAVFTNRFVTLGECAFDKCTSLDSVVFTEHVATIGTQAFANCTSLRSVTFPETVDTIMEKAFSGCTALESITIQNVGELGTRAFAASGLKKIDITNATTIGEYVFEKCVNLTTFEADRVDVLGAYAFTGCIALQNVACGTIGDIASYAFNGCTALTQMTLPVTSSVGEYAFAGCNALRSVVFTNEFANIYSYAFANSPALESVRFEKTVQSIHQSAFEGCKKLNDLLLPAGILEIGASAFEGCIALTDVTVPGGTIYTRAFAASGLKQAVLLSEVNYIEDGVFADCKALAELTIPFVGNSQDNTYSTYFGQLFGTTNESAPACLKRVTVGGGSNTAIPSDAFNGCRYIEEIILTDGVVSIGSSAFGNCARLFFISLPRTLNSIAYGSFSECRRLFEVENLSTCDLTGITEYALEIRTSSASRCPVVQVDDYRFACYNGNWYLIDFNANATELIMPSVVYNGSTVNWSIPRHMFLSNDRITSVTMPSDVVGIGEEAFFDCTSLSVLKLSSGIQSIGSYAFLGCNNLFDVYYNGRRSDIVAGSAEMGYVARYAVVVHTNMNDAPSREITYMNGQLIVRKWQGHALILYYHGDASQLMLSNLSSDITDLRVWEGAFRYNNLLEKVVFGKELTLIHRGAFEGCGNLREVIMEGDNCREIEADAFYSCGSLRNVTLSDSITKIGARAFNDCGALEEINIPTSLETIGESAFAGCVRLLSVTLPRTLEKIDNYAFDGCTLLYEIINRSSLVLTKGGSGYGGVARNAKVITSSPTGGLTRYEKGGVLFLSYTDGGTHYYIYSASGSTSGIFEIPAYGSNVEILYGAFAYFAPNEIVLPTTVKSVQYDAFRNIPSVVYYGGDRDDWTSVNFPSGNYTLYYYGDCVHDYRTWTRGDSNEVVTTQCVLTLTEITPATCWEMGENRMVCTCPGCDYSIAASPSPLLEHDFNNGVCKHCGATANEIDETLFGEYVGDGSIDASSPHTFAYQDGVLTSTNSGKDDTQATLTILAKSTMTVELRLRVSSEAGYDKLYLYHRDASNTESLLDSFSGEQTTDVIRITLNAGERLLVVYSKDSGGAHGEDTASIQELTFIFKQP